MVNRNNIFVVKQTHYELHSIQANATHHVNNQSVIETRKRKNLLQLRQAQRNKSQTLERNHKLSLSQKKETGNHKKISQNNKGKHKGSKNKINQSRNQSQDKNLLLKIQMLQNLLQKRMQIQTNQR